MSAPCANARLLGALEDRGAPSLVADGHRLDGSTLADHSHRWAHALATAGVRPGDRVAALGPPSAALVTAMLGTYRLGAVWVPVNPRYEAAEVAHVVRDSGAVVVLVDPTLRPRLSGVPDVVHLALATPTLAAPPQPRAASPDAATAMLIYTSGTTGPSKGVALSYGALAAGIGALTDAWGFSPDDVLSLQLPLFHVHGLCIGIHGALQHGMTVRLSPRFSPAQTVADVRDHGATVFMGVPTMYHQLLAHLDCCPDDARALHRARLFTAGSAALPVADLARFEARTGHRILERYGMSETLITLSNPLHGERRAGSVGLPLPGVAIRIVDEHGADLPDGSAGELLVRCPGMMTGYHGQPDATAAAFRDGWLQTGDLAVREPDGYVRIVGRISVDIIKSGGFKLAAGEIEAVLAGHPAIAEVAVVGADDPQWGERIVAAVVVAAGHPRDPAALLAGLAEHCRGVLADYKKPRQVLVVDALPRNAMGKVLKVVLRRQAQAGYAPAAVR